MPADRRVAGQLLYELMTTDLRERVADLKVPTAMLYPYDEPAPSKAMADAVYGGAYGSAKAVTLARPPLPNDGSTVPFAVSRSTE